MRGGVAWLPGFALLFAQVALGQGLTAPAKVEAGKAFTIQTQGSGKATLYLVSPAQVYAQEVQLGAPAEVPVGALYNAGHYLAFVGGSSGGTAELDVVAARQPATVGFLAKPSRLPVGLKEGISGAVYVFDAYQNLVTTPVPVSFSLSTQAGAGQARSVTTRNGAAWTQLDSTPKEGSAKFIASVDGVSAARIIEQVPGDPCGLRFNARPAGNKVEVTTDPVRDCGGNAVPDGSIVTFTEVHDGGQSTVDVPIKRGIARAQLPAHPGARISVASGVVMGNEIRWGR